MALHLEFSETLSRIAESLVSKYHPHLRGVEIAYLIKVNESDLEEEPKRRGRPKSCNKKIRIAWASLVNSKYRLLFSKDYRFIITANMSMWDGLSFEQQTAVVDHELTHCYVDEDGSYRLRKHDLEEFRSTVARHGAYLADIQAFAEALQRGKDSKEKSVA